MTNSDTGPDQSWMSAFASIPEPARKTPPLVAVPDPEPQPEDVNVEPVTPVAPEVRGEPREQPAVAEPRPAAKATAVRRPRATKDAAPVQTKELADDAPYRQVSFWIPVTVRERIDADCANTGRTLGERVVDAFNAQYSHLGEYFTATQRPQGPMPVRKARRRRRLTETNVQLYVYLTPDEVQVLDDAVDTFGAGSRSELMTRVLDADLPLTYA